MDYFLNSNLSRFVLQQKLSEHFMNDDISPGLASPDGKLLGPVANGVPCDHSSPRVVNLL